MEIFNSFSPVSTYWCLDETIDCQSIVLVWLSSGMKLKTVRTTNKMGFISERVANKWLESLLRLRNTIKRLTNQIHMKKCFKTFFKKGY